MTSLEVTRIRLHFRLNDGIGMFVDAVLSTVSHLKVSRKYMTAHLCGFHERIGYDDERSNGKDNKMIAFLDTVTQTSSTDHVSYAKSS